MDFYESQPLRVQDKIEWILGLIRDVEWVPVKYFEHVSGTHGLYEIRVECEGNIYRIFAFFDAGNLIVLGNAFHKKSQRTPLREIEKALRIKKEYFNEKE